ncbi:MAG TPA: hypothetical protein VHY08_17435 [Bacillota bacterium]|nr:hypothetical protein [Bacillota bacterium]
MSKRFVRILILLSLIIILAGATGYAYNWDSANIKVVETVKSGDQTTLTLRDKDKHLFKVSYPGNNLPDDVAKSIIKYKTEFFSWRNLKMQEITFVLSLDILEIVIIPDKILYNGANIVSAIPAGLVFEYDPASPDNGLQYNFKILKDNLIARVNGKYTTEAEFDKQLFRVYDNPKAYLSGAKPTEPVEPSPTPTRKITPTGTRRPTGKTTVTPTGAPIGPEATLPTGVLTKADFDLLMDKILQLQAENERLRYALLNLENKEGHPISRETLLKVIALKSQYPNLTFNELLGQLRKDGVRINRQELYLILAIYFNEYNEKYL